MSRSITGWSVVSDDHDIAQLEGIWRCLEKEANSATPFQGFAWCRQWLAHRACGAVPYVLLNEDRGILIPFVRATMSGVRILRFIGTGDSDYLGILSAAERAQAWFPVVDELARRRSEWDVLHLHSIAHSEDVLQALHGCRRMTAIARAYESCPYIAIDGEWNKFLAGRKKVKYELKRWARRLSELGNITTDVIPTPATGSVLGEMVEVEKSSWKWDLGTAALKPGSQAHFITAILQDSTMPARVWLLRLHGTLIAFAVVFEAHRTWYYYLPSYRKEFPNSGAHLLAAIVEEAFRSGCTCVDLLQGDHGYKALWTDETTAVSEIVAAHSFKGRIALNGYRLRWFAASNAALRRLRARVWGVGDRRQGIHSE